MNLLLTGASGFLGKSLFTNLSGTYNVKTISRSDAAIICDLSKEIPSLNDQNYEVVIHAAGKAHIIPKTESQAKEFFDTNVAGTENLLNALESNPPKWFVLISTVSVYGLDEGANIDENFPLDGSSPYALSRIQAESIVQDWCDKKNVKVLILRLPLLVGKAPKGNLKSMIDGIRRRRYLSIDGGKARKSALHVDDVADCILKNFQSEGTYNLCDGLHPSFREFEQVICKSLNSKLPPSIPLTLAAVLGKVGDILNLSKLNSLTINKMSRDLTFSDLKARKHLQWNPRSAVSDFEI